MKDVSYGQPMLTYAILLVAAIGCSAPQPQAITDAQALAVRDTVIVLEKAMNLAIDRRDCAAGFEYIGDREPLFLSSGHVVRKRAALREVCETMNAPRTGSVFVADTVTANALSLDAAYVVREGVYTINMKDGTSHQSYMVMTTIWSRQSGGWKMVHLHESSHAVTP